MTIDDIEVKEAHHLSEKIALSFRKLKKFSSLILKGNIPNEETNEIKRFLKEFANLVNISRQINANEQKNIGKKTKDFDVKRSEFTHILALLNKFIDDKKNRKDSRKNTVIDNLETDKVPDYAKKLIAKFSTLKEYNKLFEHKTVDGLLKSVVRKSIITLLEKGKELPKDAEKLENQLTNLINQVFSLPKEDKPETILRNINTQIDKKLQQLNHTTFKLPENYALYAKGTDALEHVEKYFSPFLKHFTPSLDTDCLFRDQIKQIDENLYYSILNQRGKIKRRTGKSLSEIIPPKKSRNTLEVNQYSEKQRKESLRIVANIQRRKTI